MNRLALFIILIAGSLVQAQNKKFEDLFVPARESCWEKENRISQEIIQNSRQQNLLVLDSLLSYWAEDCENSEVLIRTRILHQLSQGQKLDSNVNLSSFYQVYINNLSYLRHSDEYQKYLSYTTDWAQEILNEKANWEPREKLCLDILSRSTYQASLNRIYRRSSQKLQEGKEAEQLLAEDGPYRSTVFFDVAYQNTLFTENLGERLGTAHGLALSLGARFSKHSFGIDFKLCYPSRSDTLRIDLEDLIQESDLNSLMYLGLFYSYEFLQGPRTSLAFRPNIGFSSFGTDLSTYDPENDIETPFALDAFTLGLGLEWKIRIYGNKQIGIRSSYNLLNLSRNNELRSNLNGSLIQSSLFFRF